MRTLTALLLAALVAACASSPPPRFYALAAPGPAPGARALDGPSIAVGPVTLPEAVDRPQVVTQRAAHELRIEEFSRWAAPLRAEVARVTAEHLAALRTDARVVAAAAAPATPDYRLALDVRRFDLMPGDGTTLDVVWSLSSGGKALRSARVVIAEPAQGGGVDALVAAQSRALERLAREIAPALPPR